jgi:CRISPR/Cas system type I-B associated protein Csh2 (Cas7 group RAMP superfamily)
MKKSKSPKTKKPVKKIKTVAPAQETTQDTQDMDVGDSHVRSGILSLPDMYTLAPVEIVYATQTSKSGVQDGIDRGMAPQGHKVVKHGVYIMEFGVNSNLAYRTGATRRDVLAALQLFPLAYSSNPSCQRNNVNVTIRGLWLFDHGTGLFSGAQPGELFPLVIPKIKPAILASGKNPTCWGDYDSPSTQTAQKELSSQFPHAKIKLYNLKEELMDKCLPITSVLPGVNDPSMPFYSGCMVIEVKSANLNGDPDDQGAPRRHMDGTGYALGVSFARKLRDMVSEKDKKGSAWEGTRKILGITDAEDQNNFQILESRGRDRTEIGALIKTGVDNFLNRYWDARLWGNTFLVKSKKKEQEEAAAKEEAAARSEKKSDLEPTGDED